jgi:hypothetical protein
LSTLPWTSNENSLYFIFLFTWNKNRDRKVKNVNGLPERGLADVPSPPDTDNCGRSTEGGRTTALKDPI